MAYTEPLYAAPIVTLGTESILIAVSTGGIGVAVDIIAPTLTAGTYYNHILSDTGGLLSFPAMLETQLNAADTGSPWTVSTVSTGLGFRIGLLREGAAGEAIDYMISSFGTSHLGWSATTIAESGSEITNGSPTADDTTVTPSYQRGYVWLPRVKLAKIRQTRRGTSTALSTMDGTVAAVDGYGNYRMVTHVLEYVPGVVVEFDKSEDVQLLGYSDALSSMVDGDPNISLETFWKRLQENTGAAPVVQYLQDNGTLTSPEAITFAEADWFSDIANVAEIMSESPLLYRVTMRGHKSA